MASLKTIAQNKKAHHDYFIEETYEAGIELFGTEVKSIRQGRVNLKDSWCSIVDGEIFVNKRTVARCFCKIHWYNEEIGKTHRHRAKYAEKFVGILNSYLGIMSHYSSGATRKKIAETVLSVWEGYIVFDEEFTKARPVSK